MRSKPKRNRKVWALINPVEHAIRGACITPQHELDKLRLRESLPRWMHWFTAKVV